MEESQGPVLRKVVSHTCRCGRNGPRGLKVKQKYCAIFYPATANENVGRSLFKSNTNIRLFNFGNKFTKFLK